MTRTGAVGIFGGTFNPVHFGHLRSARELLERLPLDELRFVPARQPPHRDAPQVSAADRAAMVELAIAGEPRLRCDRRELERSGPSYSVDTLESLRRELGDERPLALVLGGDAVLGLTGWHRWPRLLALAHLVVIARPGWQIPDDAEVAPLLRERAIAPAQLLEGPAGGILQCSLTPQDISATAVRALLQSGFDTADCLPQAVAGYIAEHGLYSQGEKGPSQR